VALGLVFVVSVANLIVYQYIAVVSHAAVDDGVRIGSVDGASACEQAIGELLAPLVSGGSIGDVAVRCSNNGAVVAGEVRVVAKGWLPLVPDHVVTASAGSAREAP